MDLTKYRYIIGYGIGQYYDYIKDQIPSNMHFDFLCDARWEQVGQKYDNRPVISPEELKNMDDSFVVVFTGNSRNWQSIAGMLDSWHIPYAHADQIIGGRKTISGKELKNLAGDVYVDSQGNRILFCRDIEDAIVISFLGDNNLVEIGKGVSAGNLQISCGNNAVCSIGQGTEIEEAKIIITDGKIEIGEDCLLSTSVVLRNHDKHHIFDIDTGKRINYPGNMKIGNHVWICHGATLLGNAIIGDNSIVGTMAVTSSAFPKEVIIAGSPAKIIREHVCWSKDNTNFYNRGSLAECMAQEAIKYM